MTIETIIVGPFEVNCYLVYNEEDSSGVIIDPGDEEERIMDRIVKNGIKPAAILLTHGHGDHIAAVEPLKEHYRLPLYIGKGDEQMLTSPSGNISAMFGYEIVCPPADHILQDGDVFRAGSLEFTVLATPGHTRGGICYFAGKNLFCGDTLFNGSIGRTDLPGGNFEQLIGAIERNILTLPDDIFCYPGHGPATTVGAERKSNPFLTGRHFA
ncbi:MAG: MBL fold metallo-hydrolase [Candidatus Zixiibacteriota bacterium]|nr:MAG: MBL fold metallo-hydrolase [candidate division Zixibacteria bacterium]